MEARDLGEMTYEAYIALERASATKHEYVNGRVYAMAGGSPEHARLAQAMGGELRAALRGKPCAPFSSDLRVRVVAKGRSTYPDVTVICGRVEHAIDDDGAATNPSLIVEVLSETTESADRGDKWAHYQRIPTLGEYVLVSQSSRRIEVYSRDPEIADRWHYQEHGKGATLALARLGVTLDVDAIYADPLVS